MKSTLIKVRANLDKFKGVKAYKGRDGNYVDLAIFISPDINQFNQNVTCTVDQSKEERENGMPKVYIGNGSVLSKGDFDVVEYKKKEAQDKPVQEETNDLPF